MKYDIFKSSELTDVEREAFSVSRPVSRRDGTYIINADGKCCAATRLDAWHDGYCSKKAKTFYGRMGYCGTHDPAKIKERIAKRNAKWDVEWAEKQAGWKFEKDTQFWEKACVEAIEKIAGGYNDARGLAMELMAVKPQKPETDNG